MGGGPLGAVIFAGALGLFAIGEPMLAPTLPAMVNDLASDELRGRYNGLSTMAWTIGFMLGPAIAGVTLGMRGGPSLFYGLIAACGCLAAGAALLARRLPSEINRVHPEDAEPTTGELSVPLDRAGDGA